jgi:hypothetical protein
VSIRTSDTNKLSMYSFQNSPDTQITLILISEHSGHCIPFSEYSKHSIYPYSLFRTFQTPVLLIFSFRNIAYTHIIHISFQNIPDTYITRIVFSEHTKHSNYFINPFQTILNSISIRTYSI